MTHERYAANLSPEGKLFFKASGKYPSTVTGQAVYIAIEAKKTGLDIKGARERLEANTADLKNLTYLADHAHAHLKDMIAISVDLAKSMMNQAFRLAELFIELSIEQLENILETLYIELLVEPKVQGKPDWVLIRNEDVFESKVRELIWAERQKELERTKE